MKKFFLKVLYFILKIFALSILKVRKPKIIAITGSVAKSSAKEAIFAILNPRLDVAKNEGNLNTEIGVPLAILGFKKSYPSILWPLILLWAFFLTLYYILPISHYPKVLILEMAADKPGDIEYLTSFIKPDIAVITMVGPSHLQSFGTILNVAEEKSKLISKLSKKDYAILNKYDNLTSKMAKLTKAKVIFFEPKEFSIAMSSAYSVGKIFGLSDKTINEGLQNINQLKGRWNIIEGIAGSILIDDTYNANPLSMEYALQKLKRQKEKRKNSRTIAVLGDMLELGDYAKKGHEKVGKIAKENCDLVLCTGKLAEIIASNSGGKYFQNKDDLIAFLKKNIQKDDIILVKASRGMRFEEIVDKIKMTS